MAKNRSTFACTACGAQAASWSGRCFNCGEWNTLQEEIEVNSSSSAASAGHSSGRQLKAKTIQDIDKLTSAKRLKIKIAEIDTVLGGGLVAGSVTLLAGQPGIGKSTLLLQISNAVAQNHKVLYVSGEESEQQIALRAKRLGAKAANLSLVSSTNANDIAATIAKGGYDLVIVDSIQTIRLSEIPSSAGSVGQITNCTHILSNSAKQANCSLLLVGHVTKEGSIAGPKILEHLVDVVLHLEGDRYGGFKVLRSIKNRYGSTNEAGIFEMSDDGLQPVDNPSAALLAERLSTDGSVVLATMEGSRPLLVEVQALVNKTAYGYAKRTASGVDINRVNLLIAMLERRTKLKLAECDIYVNIVGGIKVNEPAADLAICMAIASAAKSMRLKQDVVVFGEVGLSGEVRRVPHIEKRIAEAQKLGFVGALGPASYKQPLSGPKTKSGFLSSVPDVRTALNRFLTSN